MAKALKIKSTKDGFRRAGRSFSSTEDTLILLKDLKEGEKEALLEEPILVVVEVDIDTKADIASDAASKNAPAKK